MTDSDDALISQIKSTLSERGVTPTAFGRQVANDSMLLIDLRKGRELRKELRIRLEKFLAGEPLPAWTPKRKKPKRKRGDA
jgi:hypothetical protein